MMKQLLLVISLFVFGITYSQNQQYIRGQYELERLSSETFTLWIATQHFLFNPEVQSSVLIRATSYTDDKLDLRFTRKNDSVFVVRSEFSSFPVNDSLFEFSLINGFVKWEPFEPQGMLIDSVDYKIELRKVENRDTSYTLRLVHKIDPQNRFNYQTWTSTSYSEDKDSSGYSIWNSYFLSEKGWKISKEIVSYMAPVSKIDSDSVHLTSFLYNLNLKDSTEERFRNGYSQGWLERKSKTKYYLIDDSATHLEKRPRLRVNKHHCIVYYENRDFYSFEVIPDGKPSRSNKNR